MLYLIEAKHHAVFSISLRPQGVILRPSQSSAASRFPPLPLQPLFKILYQPEENETLKQGQKAGSLERIRIESSLFLFREKKLCSWPHSQDNNPLFLKTIVLPAGERQRHSGKNVLKVHFFGAGLVSFFSRNHTKRS